MKSFFKELFEYNHHFNQKLANAFNENPDQITDRAAKLYSHILNAHRAWNNRIQQKQKVYDLWQAHSAEEYEVIDKENYEYSLHLVEKKRVKRCNKLQKFKG